jgi:hypothetical protein
MRGFGVPVGRKIPPAHRQEPFRDGCYVNGAFTKAS